MNIVCRGSFCRETDCTAQRVFLGGRVLHRSLCRYVSDKCCCWHTVRGQVSCRRAERHDYAMARLRRRSEVSSSTVLSCWRRGGQASSVNISPIWQMRAKGRRRASSEPGLAQSEFAKFDK